MARLTNTRIKELAEQCWNKRPEGQLHFDNEKFAELIVKKCMDVAKYHTPDTEECEYTWLIHDKIQKYFGVEE
jgi:hypothetical protein